MNKVTYNIGDKVLAKVKGYPPWPAKIDGDTGKKKYNVIFYGTKEVGLIKVEDICYYLENKANIVKKYVKRAGYGTAVKEIEAAIEKDGGDGSGKTLDEISNQAEATVVSKPLVVAKTPAPEKRGVKRKSTLSETLKKSVGRRKSGISETKDEDSTSEISGKQIRRKSELSENGENNEEKSQPPVAKKPRRKSSILEFVTIESTKDAPKTNDTNKNINESKEETNDVADSDQIKEETKEEDLPQFKEPEEPEKNTDNSSLKSNIVTEQMLNNNILYAKHIMKNADLYKDKPVEDREDNKDHMLAVKLPSGTICGLKLHKEWPLEHKNEYDRALYDEKISKTLLEVKDQIITEKKTIDQIDSCEVIRDLKLTSDDLNEIVYTKDIESKKKRLDRLKREADLVTWDSKIKMNLSLDRALLDEALDCLNEFDDMEKGLDALMIKKHPHVLDTIRRLRKYVGNVVAWKMDGEELNFFIKKAEKIRHGAERIFQKLKAVIKIEDPKPTFWDAFLESVSVFKTQCKDLSDLEFLVLCAEPNSRQAFLDKLDESAEPDVGN